MATQPPDLKPTLTRSRIVAQAVAIADELGVEAVSMRKLAERLGAGTMSLYTYVANKDDLVEGMVDLLSGDIELPVTTGDWRQSIRDSAASAHRVLLTHPWLAAEWSKRPPGPNRMRFMETILQTLADAGLDDGLVYRGYHAVTMHVVGFTIQELGYKTAGGAARLADVADELLDELHGAGMPHLANHLGAHLHGHDHDEFGFVLDLILDGLQRHSNT